MLASTEPPNVAITTEATVDPRSLARPIITGQSGRVGLVVAGALLLLYRAGWEVAYRTRPTLHLASTRWYNHHTGLGLLGLAMILAGMGASVEARAMVVAAGLTGLLAVIRAVAARS